MLTFYALSTHMMYVKNVPKVSTPQATVRIIINLGSLSSALRHIFILKQPHTIHAQLITIHCSISLSLVKRI